MAVPGYSTRTFQIWLNWLPAVSPKIAEDGVIGANTQRAIRQAQAAAGLPQTGTITAEIADYVYGYFVAVTGGLNLNASLLNSLQVNATQTRVANTTASQANDA
jgi:peptidoglycan hydrolase-like protein with peptidoglycan-binding domain